jgi:hypothetical protein
MKRAGGDLVAFVAEELARPVSAGALAVADGVRELYGEAVRGILFYGSCLRRSDDEGVLDLYVFVDGYRSAYDSRWLALLNAVLPPNVFYFETRLGERTIRAKYAVLSLSDLARATSRRTFEPYFWARFAQPCALVYAADSAVAREVSEALAEAVVTFVEHGTVLVPERFTAAELWKTTLRETYRCEVRAERAVASVDLYLAAPERYAAVTRLAFGVLRDTVSPETAAGETRYVAVLPPWRRRAAPWVWRLRRVHGSVLFLLRLLRNGLIFEGGVDYVIWKIERHSGVEVDRSWRQRRFRLLGLGAELWRLYRRGAIR